MPPRGRRPSGGPDTRDAILAAAREAFAETGFDRTTLRAVAERAGVDPSLILHYFGSKAGLLAATLSVPFDASAVLAGVADHPETAGAEIVRRVVGLWESDPQVRVVMAGLLRVGLAQEEAASMLREALGRTILDAVGAIVSPDDAGLRAALVGSQVAGLFLGRYVVRIPALAQADPEQLVVAVGPALQHYVDGTISTPRRPRRRGMLPA